MGFEHWEVGFGKKVGWEMGLVPPLQDPLYRTSARLSGTCPTVVASCSPPFVFFIFTTVAFCEYALEGSGMQLHTSLIRGLDR